MDKMKIFPENKENDSILEKRVKISLSVSLKHIILALLLLSAFLLGRYIFPTENGIVISNISLFSSGAQAQEERETTELQVLTTTQSNITTNTTKTNTTPPKGTQVNTTTKAATSNTSAAESVVTITNGYKNIKLEFTQQPSFSWKGNWGKIKTIYYKITNNEAGTILPSDIVVSLEGYETTQTTMHLPSIDTIINAGETKAHGVDVDIAYNQAVTDPTNIQITMHLFDKNNRSMAATTKEFNLKG